MLLTTFLKILVVWLCWLSWMISEILIQKCTENICFFLLLLQNKSVYVSNVRLVLKYPKLLHSLMNKQAFTCIDVASKKEKRCTYRKTYFLESIEGHQFRYSWIILLPTGLNPVSQPLLNPSYMKYSSVMRKQNEGQKQKTKRCYLCNSWTLQWVSKSYSLSHPLTDSGILKQSRSPKAVLCRLATATSKPNKAAVGTVCNSEPPQKPMLTFEPDKLKSSAR